MPDMTPLAHRFYLSEIDPGSANRSLGLRLRPGRFGLAAAMILGNLVALLRH